MVIDAVINKYSFHLPLYRQSLILERESGLRLSREQRVGTGQISEAGVLYTTLLSVVLCSLLHAHEVPGRQG